MLLCCFVLVFFFFKQKTAYEMRISDWSSDVCSSDLVVMLTWWSSPEEAGIYSAAARLSEVWYFVPTLLMNAVFPGLLSLRRSDPDQYDLRVQDLFDLLAAAGTLLAIAVTLTAWWFKIGRAHV